MLGHSMLSSSISHCSTSLCMSYVCCWLFNQADDGWHAVSETTSIPRERDSSSVVAYIDILCHCWHRSCMHWRWEEKKRIPIDLACYQYWLLALLWCGRTIIHDWWYVQYEMKARPLDPPRHFAWLIVLCIACFLNKPGAGRMLLVLSGVLFVELAWMVERNEQLNDKEHQCALGSNNLLSQARWEARSVRDLTCMTMTVRWVIQANICLRSVM